jgi:arylsulfatase A-like enzyme
MRAEKPFFMYLAGPTPHSPYGGTPAETIEKYEAMNLPMPPNFRTSPEPLRTREVSRDEISPDWIRKKYTNPYHGTMDYFDGQMGRLFAELKQRDLYDNTIIIYTTDQGIAHGHHGLIHKTNLYECTMNVPFIIRGPGISQPSTMHGLAYLFDVFPTVCELVGIPVPEDMQGRSFAQALRDPNVTEHRESVVLAYTTRDGIHAERAIRMGDAKLYYYPETESFRLFDLSQDPYEINDLSTDQTYSASLSMLYEKMREELEAMGDPWLKPGTTVLY